MVNVVFSNTKAKVIEENKEGVPSPEEIEKYDLVIEHCAMFYNDKQRTTEVLNGYVEKGGKLIVLRATSQSFLLSLFSFQFFFEMKLSIFFRFVHSVEENGACQISCPL